MSHLGGAAVGVPSTIFSPASPSAFIARSSQPHWNSPRVLGPPILRPVFRVVANAEHQRSSAPVMAGLVPATHAVRRSLRREFSPSIREKSELADSDDQRVVK